MQKTTLTPTNDIQLQHWIDKLKAAEVEYDIQTLGGKPVLVLDEDAAETVLGIEKPKPRPKWIKYLLIAVALFWAIILIIPPSEVEAKPLSEMTEEELNIYYTEVFGTKGDWVWDYSVYVGKNYTNFPKTMLVKEVRIFPIDKDSLTHVLIYEAKNAFGVPSDHSITSVINSNGEIERVVSYQ